MNIDTWSQTAVMGREICKKKRTAGLVPMRITHFYPYVDLQNTQDFTLAVLKTLWKRGIESISRASRNLFCVRLHTGAFVFYIFHSFQSNLRVCLDTASAVSSYFCVFFTWPLFICSFYFLGWFKWHETSVPDVVIPNFEKSMSSIPLIYVKDRSLRILPEDKSFSL